MASVASVCPARLLESGAAELIGCAKPAFSVARLQPGVRSDGQCLTSRLSDSPVVRDEARLGCHAQFAHRDLDYS